MDTNAVRPITNKCLYFNERSKECIIFDPGHEGEKLVTYVQEEQLKPLAVLLTHAHFDHIGAVDAVRDAFHIPVYVHKEEADWLGDATVNGSQIFMMNRSITAKPADHIIDAEGTLTIGSFNFEILRHQDILQEVFLIIVKRRMLYSQEMYCSK